MLYRIFIAIASTLLMMASSLGKEKKKLSVTARGCREFSSNFHKAISRNTEGNIVDSPLGTHLVLSYLFKGSDNRTATEMMAGLCLPDTERLCSEYKDFIDIVDMQMDKVELSLANAIFLQKGVQLLETFHTTGRDFFNFTVENVDFRDNVGSAETINSWVSKNTNDKINDILSPDDIDDYTKVVLANAIYFKGQWRYQFDAKATQKRIFHLTDTRNKQISTMFKEFKYSHGEIPSLNSRFLEIPYMDEKLDMIIILPNEIQGLKFLEENFDWNAVVNAQRSKRVTQLYLPKFKIEATINLKNVLIELGFASMFENTADLTKMSDLPLKVDSVIQKAFIEVNELGTEAAAATVVRMMMKRSLEIEEKPDEFFVDRPFIVAVRYVPDDTPLFLSSVRDIMSSTPGKDEL